MESVNPFSIEVYLESLRSGANWLGVGIVVTLLATLGLCMWLLYRLQQPEAIHITPDITLLGNTEAGLKVEDPRVQARIRDLQAAYNRGDIDGAAFRAGLAELRQGRIA